MNIAENYMQKALLRFKNKEILIIIEVYTCDRIAVVNREQVNFNF